MTYNDIVEMKKVPYASTISSIIASNVGSLMYAQVCTRPNIAFAMLLML